MNATTARELDNAFDQYRIGFADALAKHGIAAFIIGDRRGVAKVTRRQRVRKNATTPNINYDAATAYIRKYRDDLINRGGTYVWDNKLKQVKFAPWLKDGSDELRRGVEAVIEDGFKEGKSSVKVTKELKEYFDEDSTHDPKQVARTERARLEGAGERENYRENDIELVGWLLGDRACEDCIDVANTDVGYGPGIYPIDDCPPIPQHPGCECDTAPVTGGSGE